MRLQLLNRPRIGAARRLREGVPVRTVPSPVRYRSVVESTPFALFASDRFTSAQFHVLLNSLFKVLFTFPSRYLYAIGLVVVFSLRWSLPPTWVCTLKQTDSKERSTRRTLLLYGPVTLCVAPFKLDLSEPRCAVLTDPPKRYISRRARPGGFSAGLFPVRSPLLRES